MARTLDGSQPVSRVLPQLIGQCVAGHRPFGGLYYRDESLAHVLIRYTEDGDLGDLGIKRCSVILLVEPIAARRQLALELGATHVIDPAAGSVDEAIRAILPDGAEFAFETSGREAVVESGLKSLGSHGLLGLVGVPPRVESSVTINLAAIITFGHRIHGIIEGDSDPDRFIPELIEHYRAGRFPLDRLITTYPLDRINDAIAAQHRGDCVKAVLLP